MNDTDDEGIGHHGPKDRDRRVGLLPCPFCGGTKLQTINAGEYFEDRSLAGTAVLCHCGAHGGFIKTTRAAIEKWNTRTPSVAVAPVEVWEAIEKYGAAMQSMVGARLCVGGYPTQPYAEKQVEEAREILKAILEYK